MVTEVGEDVMTGDDSPSDRFCSEETALGSVAAVVVGGTRWESN